MKLAFTLACISASVLIAVPGCSNLPGRPADEPEVPRPESVVSFDKLYSENCAGCHGANGQNGAATDLANPEYQALVDESTLRDIIANGEKGTLMPGFSQRSGGELSDAQIDALVREMRARWYKRDALSGTTCPPYKAAHAGDTAKGQKVYQSACASCHGESAQMPGKDGSILDGSFLALLDDQSVRTTVIAGRPDIGQPDWRNDIHGRPLSDDDVTNVTAWLLSQKPLDPGQPYPNRNPTGDRAGEGQPLANSRK